MAIYLIKDQSGTEKIYSEANVVPFSREVIEAAKQAIVSDGFSLDEKLKFYFGPDSQLIKFVGGEKEVQLQDVGDVVTRRLVDILQPKYFLDDDLYENGRAHLMPIGDLVGAAALR